jgi:hypothetical protein
MHEAQMNRNLGVALGVGRYDGPAAAESPAPGLDRETVTARLEAQLHAEANELEFAASELEGLWVRLTGDGSPVSAAETHDKAVGSINRVDFALSRVGRVRTRLNAIAQKLRVLA